MPSPIGHGLAGLAVCAVFARSRAELFDLPRGALIVGAAIVPDLDLLLRVVDGRSHHQAESHSIGCAALAALLAAVVAWSRSWPRAGSFAAAVGVAWLSHVALDYLSLDTSVPVGLMALWPLSDGYYKTSWPVFLDTWRKLDWAAVRHNTVAVAWEALILTPPVVLSWRRRSRS